MTIVPVMTIVPIIKTMTIFIILVVRFLTGHYEYRDECRQVLNLFLFSCYSLFDCRPTMMSIMMKKITMIVMLKEGLVIKSIFQACNDVGGHDNDSNHIISFYIS